MALTILEDGDPAATPAEYGFDFRLLTAADIERFLNAGYTSAQVLEVVLGVGVKTLSNYTLHLADTPLDRAFANAAWAKAA